MAVSSSMSLPLGASVPDFALPEVTTGRVHRPADFAASRALLIVFLCRHCPYVVHIRPELQRIATDFAPEGLAVVGISSNDPVSYPEDAPDKLAEMVRQCGITFPILFDESQDVARAFAAACTPDFFLFDGARKLAYRGRMDASTPGNGLPVTGADLRAAVQAVLAGKPVPGEQWPSLGCSIKWRSQP